MSKFQLILTGVFAAFIVVGVLIFAFFRGGSAQQVKVAVWGTVPQEVMDGVIGQSSLAKSKTIAIVYTEKNPATFYNEFINALASGTGPDVILLPHTDIIKNQSKIFPIPFSSYPERTFLDTFVQEGELLLNTNGVLAVPITVDPLVMYWNRDIFTNKTVAKPPSYWDEFYNLAQVLIEKDGALNIVKSPVALGEYRNVRNAKAILSSLLFQAGTPIVTVNGVNKTSELTSSFNLPVNPAVAALTFYTEFSNPAKPFYSWNRSLPDSQSMFVSGDLAMYFGFSSELNTIRLKNPNLNFDVTNLPQSRSASKTITYGNMYAMAIVKNSQNISSAFQVIAALTTGATDQAFANALHIPPSRRDLLSQSQTDPYQSVFYRNALWSEGWYDPDSTATNNIFQKMVETITGGRSRLESAINQAHQELQNLLRNS